MKKILIGWFSLWFSLDYTQEALVNEDSFVLPPKNSPNIREGSHLKKSKKNSIKKILIFFRLLLERFLVAYGSLLKINTISKSSIWNKSLLIPNSIIITFLIISFSSTYSIGSDIRLWLWISKLIERSLQVLFVNKPHDAIDKSLKRLSFLVTPRSSQRLAVSNSGLLLSRNCDIWKHDWKNDSLNALFRWSPLWAISLKLLFLLLKIFGK